MNNKRVFLLLTLLIFGIISLYFVHNSKDNLEEIILDFNSEDVMKYNNIAIMIEVEDGTYEESTLKKWPGSMEFNESLSKCVDQNKNEIEGALVFQDGIAKVNTSTTTYCYLYFDKKAEKQKIASYLMETKPSGLYVNEPYGGMYRFFSCLEDCQSYPYSLNISDVNNYICFGIGDPGLCDINRDKYMYRIIGIDANTKELKLIKKTELTRTIYGGYGYGSGLNSSLSWNNSRIFNMINGSDYLDNDNYFDDYWRDKIVTKNWGYGIIDAHTNNLQYWDVNRMYQAEQNFEDYVKAKIAIMYPSDYYYARQLGGTDCFSSSGRDDCDRSWIHIVANKIDDGIDDDVQINNEDYFVDEMMFSNLYTNFEYDYGVLIIGVDGGVYIDEYNGTASIRPTFYITSDAYYFAGDGTLDNPFIIEFEDND